MALDDTKDEEFVEALINTVILFFFSSAQNPSCSNKESNQLDWFRVEDLLAGYDAQKKKKQGKWLSGNNLGK